MSHVSKTGGNVNLKWGKQPFLWFCTFQTYLLGSIETTVIKPKFQNFMLKSSFLLLFKTTSISYPVRIYYRRWRSSSRHLQEKESIFSPFCLHSHLFGMFMVHISGISAVVLAAATPVENCRCKGGVGSLSKFQIIYKRNPHLTSMKSHLCYHYNKYAEVK